MAAPVPITPEVSQHFLGALRERGIEYLAQSRRWSSVDGERPARLALSSGDRLSYDLLIGIPVHRAPEVVEQLGLAVDGWVPVDQTGT